MMDLLSSAEFQDARAEVSAGRGSNGNCDLKGLPDIDPILDEKDPVPDSYNFEVCSAGLERQLKRPSDFAQFMGSSVSVKLFRPVSGAKEFVGTLTGYEDGAVTIEAAGATHTFQKNEVAQVRLHVEF